MRGPAIEKAPNEFKGGASEYPTAAAGCPMKRGQFPSAGRFRLLGTQFPIELDNGSICRDVMTVIYPLVSTSEKRRFSDVREVSFARVVSNKNDLLQPRNRQSKRDSHVRVQS
jgi:hypothetical protein